MGVIYQIVIAGGRRSYIGSTRRFGYRKSHHLFMLRAGRHHCIGLTRAVAKYGMDAISWKILETVDDAAKLIEREQHWMDQFKGCLYNASLMAAAPLGLKKTAEQIEKSARFHRGRTRSHETRSRMSASMKGNTNGRHTRLEVCKRGHRLEEGNLYFRTRGNRTERTCKACALARAKEWRV